MTLTTHRRLILGAVVLFLAVWCALLPGRLAFPRETFFSHDPGDYSNAAVSLAAYGTYSVDGSTPFSHREPGYSAFLAVVYRAFGPENRLAIFASQGLLYLTALLVFARELRKATSTAPAAFCVLLLVLIPEIYHALFTAYREGYTLCLLLLLSAAVLRLCERPSWTLAALTGLGLGVLTLTYYSFLFLPLFLAPFLRATGLRGRHVAVLAAASYVALVPWAARNYFSDGHFRIISPFRTAVMWHVRGEQAERVKGLEPLRCLWSEYISRDWEGRSPACSFNGLMHAKWPDGKLLGDEDEIAREGRRKIALHPASYLWSSAFEVLELHLPYVNGWGRTYNVLASAGVVILYIGCLLSLRVIWRREYALFFGLILYNTVVFSLTDATPRYLVPVISCYAVLSAVGYASALGRLHRRRPTSRQGLPDQPTGTVKSW